MESSKETHYFIVIEHDGWDHEGDEWIGIYDDLSKLEMIYDRACEYLKEEISYSRFSSDDRRVQIYRFDEADLFVEVNAYELFHK